MKTNVHFSYINTDELAYTGKTTVVIDVLRASTTIIQALQNGAREVIPVASVEFAVKVSGGMFGGQTLLGGERNTKKLEGFALGNSPFEYTPEVVSGKTIILFTTNGSKADRADLAPFSPLIDIPYTRYTRLSITGIP